MKYVKERLIGAALLDTETFARIEVDPDMLAPAMGIVVASSLAAGIGGAESSQFGLLVGSVVELVQWFVMAALIFLIGTRLLPAPKTQADPQRFLRTVGFGAAPGIVRILGILPVLGPFVAFGATVWMLLAMVLAVREALDFPDVARAMAVSAAPMMAYVAMKIFI
jgi:hypothetical protein